MKTELLFVASMMVVLSKEGIHSKILIQQWEAVIKNSSYHASAEYIEKHRQIINVVKDSMQLSAEQEKVYMKWCKDEIGLRIDAIVSNKYQGSYGKVARLLVAAAEALANKGEKEEAMDFIKKYRSKYPRHRAFPSEAVQALQTSGLYYAKAYVKAGNNYRYPWLAQFYL